MVNVKRIKLISAFIAVYVIWGSTYLFIKFAIQSFPPFLMAGFRFCLAGMVMYAVALAQKVPPPTISNIKSSVIASILLLLIGHGGVVWAQKFIPSGITAVLIATVPIWVAIIQMLRGKPGRNHAVLAGVGIGFIGICILIYGNLNVSVDRLNLPAALVIIMSSISWSIGTVYSNSADFPESPIQSNAIQMIAAGILLIACGLLFNEWPRLNLAAASNRSILSFIYLVIFGSLIAYSAYVWLLRNTSPNKAATYAYVNPLIAILLGTLVGDEPLRVMTIIATVVLLIGVFLILTNRSVE